MTTTTNSRLAAVLLTTLLFTACGGGSTPSRGNNPPTITIAAIDPVMELTAVTLTADAEDANGDALAFAWTQVAGTPVELAGADSAEPAFTAPKVKNSETLQFSVTVNDGQGETATATVDVIVNEANGIVYSAIEERANIEEVYFHHPAFAKPIKLHAELDIPDGTEVSIDFLQVLPDHKHVAYVRAAGEGNADDPYRLYVAALDGSGERDITGPTSPNGADFIEGVAISPDGNWIAFVGHQEFGDGSQLFVVPVASVDGSDRIWLAGDGVDQGIHEQFEWSPDSTRILFAGDLGPGDRMEIFAANIETGDLTLLTSETAPASTTYINDMDPPFAWSANGDWIAMVEPVAGGIASLHVVSPDGATRNPVATDIGSGSMQWSSTGRLAYTAHTIPMGENDARDLYIYAPDADNPGPFAVGGTSGTVPQGQVEDFDWSPDGAHIAYSTTTADLHDIFSTPAGATDASGRKTLYDIEMSTHVTFDWLADSSRVVFTRSNVGAIEMFSNTPAGDDLTLLLDPPGDSGAGVQNFTVSPHDSRIAFEVMTEGGGVDIQVIAADGTGLRTVSPPLAGDSNGAGLPPDDAAFSADGTQLLFAADPEIPFLHQLYAVSVDAADGGAAERISNLLTDTDGEGGPDAHIGLVAWVGPDPFE